MNLQKPQTAKIILLFEFLRTETDAAHPLTTEELCDRITGNGISCDRRTLSRDMKLLQDLGYNVKSKMIGHRKGYYYEQPLSTAHLRVIADAIQSAKFIPSAMTSQLIDQICFLGSAHQGLELKASSVSFNSVKHNSNQTVFETIEKLEYAVAQRQKASFYYYSLDEKRRRIYHRNKALYTVDPLALVFDNGKYYLVCYSPTDLSSVRTYRLDRMEEVSVLEESSDPKAVIRSRTLTNFTKRAFKMFSGEMLKVTLRFHDSVIGAIYDQFGEETKIKRIKNTEYCVSTVEISKSPTFWGWLFQFVGMMQILEPAEMRQEYRERCLQAMEPDLPED